MLIWLQEGNEENAEENDEWLHNSQESWLQHNTAYDDDIDNENAVDIEPDEEDIEQMECGSEGADYVGVVF